MKSHSQSQYALYSVRQINELMHINYTNQLVICHNTYLCRYIIVYYYYYYYLFESDINSP